MFRELLVRHVLGRGEHQMALAIVPRLAPGGKLFRLRQRQRRLGRLEEAQVLQGTIPESAMPAFLPVSLTRLYLSRIERGGTLEVTQFRRQITLWRAARNNRF